LRKWKMRYATAPSLPLGTAKRVSVERWTAEGEVYFETSPNVVQFI